MTDSGPEPEVLAGGVANAGAVLRVGDHVLRPSSASTATVHRLLRHLRAAGFDGAPLSVGVDPDGRERLVYVPGDVPVAPYPHWAQTDEALASIGRLLRGFHDAGADLPGRPDDRWSDELSDDLAGAAPTVVCHDDVCLENVVFVGGSAVALLDLDYAAPGRREFDVAATARMCVPVDDPLSASRLGWVERPASETGRRLRLVCDVYGLDTGGRADVMSALALSMQRGGDFVQRHVEAGEPGFAAMWAAMGGMARFDRRRAWFAEHRDLLEHAMA